MQCSLLCAGLVLLILSVQAPPASAQTDPLALASKTEKTDPAAALKLYRSAFEKASTPDAAFAAYNGIMRLERDQASLLRASLDLISRVKDAPYPSGLALSIAGYLELSGRLEEALALYARQAAAGSTEAADAAVSLCVEMNDPAAAERILGSGGASLSIQAELALQKGDWAGAEAAYEKIISAKPGQGAEIRALYGLYAAALSSGDGERIKKAADRLIAAYPGSPEAQIARGGAGSRVVLSPSPAFSLTREPPQAAPAQSASAPAAAAAATTTAAPASPAQSSSTAASPVVTPSATAAAAEPAPTAPADSEAPTAPGPAPTAAPASTAQRASVQAGSYRVRENAEDMVRELKGKGFAAVVRETSVGGVVLYKALACESVSVEEAGRILARLREIGFEGALLNEP